MRGTVIGFALLPAALPWLPVSAQAPSLDASKREAMLAVDPAARGSLSPLP